MASLDIATKERAEIEFWRTSPDESPGATSVTGILYGCAKSRVMIEKLRDYDALFAGAGRIVELGAGQGWASALVKRCWPEAHVTATDISPHAVESVPIWERVFDTKLDAVIACRSYETPFAAGSVDLVFCFSAAHHFVRHRRTFAELARILRPGGTALYLHEPTCPPLFHRLARWRVNRIRPDVPEDVLRVGTLRRLAREAGLVAERRFAPSRHDRAPVPGLYYMVLRALPWLQHLLPCSADIIIRKP